MKFGADGTPKRTSGLTEVKPGPLLGRNPFPCFTGGAEFQRAGQLQHERPHRLLKVRGTNYFHCFTSLLRFSEIESFQQGRK